MGTVSHELLVRRRVLDRARRKHIPDELADIAVEEALDEYRETGSRFQAVTHGHDWVDSVARQITGPRPAA